jgi:hypothetical protein
MAVFEVKDQKGFDIGAGDYVRDFRGNLWTFEKVTRGPEPGRSAKVEVSQDGDRREFYCTVFDLEVTEL